MDVFDVAAGVCIGAFLTAVLLIVIVDVKLTSARHTCESITKTECSLGWRPSDE